MHEEETIKHDNDDNETKSDTGKEEDTGYDELDLADDQVDKETETITAKRGTLLDDEDLFAMDSNEEKKHEYQYQYQYQYQYEHEHEHENEHKYAYEYKYDHKSNETYEMPTHINENDNGNIAVAAADN
ncbi:hypothetical protein RFI_38622, partial [Reticulomyxa filosa]